MSVLAIRDWSAQPQIAVIENRRFTSLVAAYNFAALNPPATIVGTVANEFTLGGRGPRFPATNSDYMTHSVPVVNLMLGPMTMVCAFVRIGNGGNSGENSLVCCEHDANWNNSPFQLFVLNSGELHFGRNGPTGRSWIRTVETPASVNLVCNSVVRSDTSSSGFGNAPLTSFWVNGKLLTSSESFADGSGAISSTNDTVYLGRVSTIQVSTSYASNAVLLAYGLFRSALADKLCMELSLNPWMMFDPLPRRQWGSAAAVVSTTRGRPFGMRGNAFNGGRTMTGVFDA